MFDLVITKDIDILLRKTRKLLREKGYKQTTSRTNINLGGMKLNYKTENFIKGNLLIEFERDLENNILRTSINFKQEKKEIRLADIPTIL